MEKLCFTVAEMAEKLGICKVNAYEMTKRDGFPAFRHGKRILIPISALEKWLEAQAEKGA